MNNKVKESLLEKFEVMIRTLEDCTYALEDVEDLSTEELKNKIYTRLDRINSESQDLQDVLVNVD